MNIVTIGGAMRDVFIQYETTDMVHMHTAGQKKAFIILEEGRKLEVETLAYHVGGGAANSAVSFGRLGLSASSFFKIGTDQEGDFILQCLAKENVATDSTLRTSQAGTGTSFIIPSPSGNRSVLVYRGANLMLRPDEIPAGLIAGCDQLYITSLSRDASLVLPAVAKMAKEQKKSVAVNPGTSQLTARVDTLQQALPNIDILILNSFEANLLMSALIEPPVPAIRIPEAIKKNELPELLHAPIGLSTVCFTLEQFFSEVLSRGPRIVAVTNGAEGVYATDGKKVYFHPSLEAPVVSTLGAGDAFGSCFVAQLAHGKSIADAIRAGIINSASVIQYLDTQTGLLTAEQLSKKLEELDASLLQTF